MNAAAAQKSSGHFLPDINKNNNKRRKVSSHVSLLQQQKESLQANKSAPIISKEEISDFRQSLKQNICVELLKQGYQRSFSELFFVLGLDQERISSAEPGSDLTLQTPLSLQRDKLQAVRDHLSRAEKAERTGMWTVVCEQRLALGRFFSSPEDLWLSLYFYHSCSDTQHGSRSRPAAEARGCMAQLYLDLGDVDQAMHQAELCLQLSESGGFLDSNRQPLKLRAKQLLWKTYSRLADRPLEEGDYEGALKLLHKGHSMARESREQQIEGEACYRLGLTYQRVEDHHKAREYLGTYMEICSELKDADGLGRAYKAMAKSIESEGDIQGTVRCLERLVEVLSADGLHGNLADAHLCLGRNYYGRGEYDRACEYFLKGYEVSCKLGNMPLLQKAQVLVSSARAHSVIGRFSCDVESANHDALKRLVEWKETRGRAESCSGPAWY